jgi:heme-degrading monooxygenase HmoA
MFARVSTYHSDDADKLLTGLRSVAEPLRQIDGFAEALFLVDRGSGKALSITLWDSEAAMAASVAMADELRRRGAETGRGTVESVEQYEVGLAVRGAVGGRLGT